MTYYIFFTSMLLVSQPIASFNIQQMSDFIFSSHDFVIKQARKNHLIAEKITPFSENVAHDEEAVFSVVQTIGYTKSNAKQAKKHIEQLLQPIRVVSQREQSNYSWVSTSAMKKTAYEICESYKKLALYAQYLECHALYLEILEHLELYKNSYTLSLDNHAILIASLLQWHSEIHHISSSSQAYAPYIIARIKMVERNVAKIKQFLRHENHKKLYPVTYQAALSLCATLEIILLNVQQSAEYRYEQFVIQNEEARLRKIMKNNKR